MSNYRRSWLPGGTYFFTLTLLDRRDNSLLVQHIEALRSAVNRVRITHPFTIHAWVVLPEHMHCIISLPTGAHDYALRLRRIKSIFSRSLPNIEPWSTGRQRRGQRGIWQARYWEHLIRDEADYRAHMDYVHINPLKHRYVQRVSDWPYSTFHRLVRDGVYPADWGGDGVVDLAYPD